MFRVQPIQPHPLLQARQFRLCLFCESQVEIRMLATDSLEKNSEKPPGCLSQACGFPPGSRRTSRAGIDGPAAGDVVGSAGRGTQ